LFALIASITVAGLADIPNPDREKRHLPKTWNGEMAIVMRSKDTGIATLKINRQKLNQLRAAIDQADDQATASLDDEGTPAARGQTMIAGVLLSIAMVMGGFIVFRRNDRGGKVALSIAAVSAIGVGAIAVLANTPPPRLVGLTSQIFAKESKAYGYARGQIAIQIVDDKYSPNDVTLEIPAAGDDKAE
jgi:hypothetical protein